ncbi:serine/threonine protein kinase [Nannocystis pusilla]|uniref:serine/threonine protein kinase n=1 Tax=Nannocystis pusilla TaxID=889268 RepID=UPI003DA616DD
MSLHGYITVEVLHEGMKSEVRRATRASDGRLVILKVPRAEAVTHQRLAELRHEYDIAARLKLSGVVQALALEERGLPFLVFEDFGGLSLTQCFPSKVGVGSFLAIALQLTETLAAIHEHGVIHKDIKPANIILNPRTGEVKLTDFAIASALATESVALAAPERLVGTLAYMAPEQTGRVGRGIDQRADLYALGVTFFELLTGRRPFAQSDAMELVHAHLARTPPDPAALEPSIGRELSAIVLKLMAKNVDERYRSAHALRADLEYLRATLGGDTTPSTARPRRSAEFRLPQRLYGRAAERTRLLAAFEHAAAGQRALALIAGWSGTGKSALVHELHQPIVARRGNFIAGKFDQYNRHVPFASLLQTLRQLVELVLASPLGEVERWRRRLADALGAQMAVLVDTLPDLAHVVGEQPPPPPVSGTEAQNRLHLAVLRFIGVFADKGHPLVIFLDDLQWADGATLRLLGALLGDHDLRHVLVIGAYRDHEVDAYHPLRKTIAELEQAGATIERIDLTPLGRANVAAIVADALAETPAAVADLAAEVHQRTEGNPLFVREFLRVIHGEELIRFSPELGRWTWDLAALRAASIPDDVADLLLERIRRLGPERPRAAHLRRLHRRPVRPRHPRRRRRQAEQRHRPRAVGGDRPRPRRPDRPRVPPAPVRPRRPAAQRPPALPPRPRAPGRLHPRRRRRAAADPPGDRPPPAGHPGHARPLRAARGRLAHEPRPRRPLRRRGADRARRPRPRGRPAGQGRHRLRRRRRLPPRRRRAPRPRSLAQPRPPRPRPLPRARRVRVPVRRLRPRRASLRTSCSPTPPRAATPSPRARCGSSSTSRSAARATP